MKLNNKLWIIALIIILLPGVSAIKYYWLTPNQNGELIDTYPQKVRILLTGTENITECNLTVNSQLTQIPIGRNNIEIAKELRLVEGTYTLAINCSNSTGVLGESKSFVTNDMSIFNNKKERDFNYLVYVAISIFLIVIYIYNTEPLYKLIAAGLLLLNNIYLLSAVDTVVLIIPITICLWMILIQVIKMIK